MMDERSRDVLAAADSWLTAMQAITAADEAQRRTKDQQLDLDDAELVLVAAVLTWREGGTEASADPVQRERGQGSGWPD
jgi:hypothetical protein